MVLKLTIKYGYPTLLESRFRRARCPHRPSLVARKERIRGDLLWLVCIESRVLPLLSFFGNLYPHLGSFIHHRQGCYLILPSSHQTPLIHCHSYMGALPYLFWSRLCTSWTSTKFFSSNVSPGWLSITLTSIDLYGGHLLRIQFASIAYLFTVSLSTTSTTFALTIQPEWLD